MSPDQQRQLIRRITFWLPVTLVTALLAAKGYQAAVSGGELAQLERAESQRKDEECLQIGRDYAAYYQQGAVSPTFDLAAARIELERCFKEGRATSKPGGFP